MAHPIARRLLTWIPERYVLSEVRGLENIPKGPCVVAANHINGCDGYAVGGVIIRYLHRYVYTLSNFPRHGGKCMELIGKYWSQAIYVHPQKKAEVIEKARRVLQKGELMLIFIEGTAVLNPERLGKGKTGVARLSLLERVPVIPAAITGGPHVKGVRNTLRLLKKKKMKEKLEFGAPLDFSAHYDTPITYELLQEVTKKIMLRLAEMTGQKYEY